MALKLPPLNGLRLFEAAARHQSFKQAAGELNLSPSAVSHAVQALEDRLGTSLFHRGPRGLTLTPAGAAYAEAVGRGLGLIADATARVSARQWTGTLSVSCAPSFASLWLLPRLSRFTERHPDLRVAIDTAHRRVVFPADGFDLGLRLGAGPDTHDTWIRLIDDSLVPVCAPELLRRVPRGTDAMTAGLPLIHVTTVSRGWPEWFAAAGRHPSDRDQGLRVDTLHMALNAARRGLGIALGHLPLIADDLDHGALVQAGGPVVPSGLGYWLVGAPVTFDRPEVKLFRTWILQELAAPAPAPAEAPAAVARAG